MRWFRRQPEAPPKGRHATGRPLPVAPVHPLPAPTQLPAPALAQPAQVSERPASGVHLGFSDGSDLELSVGDPRVGAFRAVARTLVGV